MSGYAFSVVESLVAVVYKKLYITVIFLVPRKAGAGGHVETCPAPLRIYNSNSRANRRRSPQHFSAPFIIANHERCP
jgi:hypothetical protein